MSCVVLFDLMKSMASHCFSQTGIDMEDAMMIEWVQYDLEVEGDSEEDCVIGNYVNDMCKFRDSSFYLLIVNVWGV